MSSHFEESPVDMLGTIRVGGHEAFMMADDFTAPRDGYYTVALEISFFAKEDGGEHSLVVNLLAVDSELVASRDSESDTPLPVFRFKTDLTLPELLKRVRRIRAVLQDESTKGLDLSILNWTE